MEFEADENEVTLTTTNLNGEWGIFIPDAAGAVAGAAAVAANADVANADAAKADAAKADAAKAEAANQEEAGDENEVTGEFDKAIATPGANQKTDILFPANVSTIPIPSIKALLTPP